MGNSAVRETLEDIMESMFDLLNSGLQLKNEELVTLVEEVIPTFIDVAKQNMTALAIDVRKAYKEGSYAAVNRVNPDNNPYLQKNTMTEDERLNLLANFWRRGFKLTKELQNG